MAKNKPVESVLVFAVESPSAADMLGGRTESQTLQSVCKMLGHEFASMTVRSNTEFSSALGQITSINEKHLPKSKRRRPLCVHIASHGNDCALGFGPHSMPWKVVAKKLWEFTKNMAHYSGPLILVISACGADKQTVTIEFTRYAKQKDAPSPAQYVLTTISDDQGEVYWEDSVVAWSIFYQQIGSAVLDNRSDIMSIIDKIALVGCGGLKYFRWDSGKKKYFAYESNMVPHIHE